MKKHKKVADFIMTEKDFNDIAKKALIDLSKIAPLHLPRFKHILANMFKRELTIKENELIAALIKENSIVTQQLSFAELLQFNQKEKAHIPFLMHPIRKDFAKTIDMDDFKIGETI